MATLTTELDQADHRLHMQRKEISEETTAANRVSVEERALGRTSLRVATLALRLLSVLPSLGICSCQNEFSTPRALADLTNRSLTGRFGMDTSNAHLLVITLSYQAGAGECFHLLPETTALLNDTPMEGTLGFTTDTGGCAIPRFQLRTTTLPADPAARFVLADSTLTVSMDVDDLFGPRAMNVRPPGDVSSLKPAEMVWLDLTPAQDLAPASAAPSMIDLSFTPDKGLAPSFDLTNPALTISGASIGFVVPGAASLGTGTLDLWTLGPVPVTQCDGADACDVQSIYERKLTATIGSP